METSNRNNKQSNTSRSNVDVPKDQEFEIILKFFLFTGIIFTRSNKNWSVTKFVTICLDLIINLLFVYFMATSVFGAAKKAHNSAGHAFISGFASLIGIFLRFVVLSKRSKIIKCSGLIAKLSRDVWLPSESKSFRRYVCIGCISAFLFPLCMNVFEFFIGDLNRNAEMFQSIYFFRTEPLKSFDPWIIAVLIFLRVSNILLWNCFPLLIMVLCSFIFTRLRNINLSFLENLQKCLDMNMPSKLFSDFTTLYGRITNIIEKVEKTYSLISFFLYGYMLSCVFSITSSLVTKTPGPLNIASVVYQIESFVEIVVCFVFLSVRAASVNESAVEVKNVIHSLPSKRFDFSPNLTATLLQLSNNFASEVCITGWGLFMINRGFILTTAGVVVTYGVILVQLGG